jgi:hypothetical protein
MLPGFTACTVASTATFSTIASIGQPVTELFSAAQGLGGILNFYYRDAA